MKKSHNIQFLSPANGHNIRYLLYYEISVVRGELLPAAAGPLLVFVAHPGGHGGHQRARRPRHEEDARAALQDLV